MPGQRPEQTPRPQQPAPAQQPAPVQQPAQQPQPANIPPADGMRPLAAYNMDMATEIKKIDSAKRKSELEAMLVNYTAIRDKINGVTPQGSTVNHGGPVQRPGTGTPTQSPFAARAARSGGSWLGPDDQGQPAAPPDGVQGRGR